MPLPVFLREVVDQFDALNDDWVAYLNRKTGELSTVTEQDHFDLETEDPDDLPDWQREELPSLREVVDSDDWLELPDSFEIHGYSIMERFCRSIEDDESRRELLDAISGPGAFRHFKSTVRRMGIEDRWYRYRDQALARIARDWLEANEIPYRDDM